MCVCVCVCVCVTGPHTSYVDPFFLFFREGHRNATADIVRCCILFPPTQDVLFLSVVLPQGSNNFNDSR